jgi:glutathione peroxidase
MNNKLTEIPFRSMDGKTSTLAEYKGKAVLVVNVASRCGLTPQYKQLEEIYRKYKDRGFIVLGFPANNFLGQEPGTDEQIREFCELNYGVTFPVFSKISVKGKDIHPLYAWLTGKETDPEFAGDITWNFNKFLLDPDGKVAGRWGREKPDDPEIIRKIESLLPKA